MPQEKIASLLHECMQSSWNKTASPCGNLSQKRNCTCNDTFKSPPKWMSVGRSGAGWQHVDCSRCSSSLWHISLLACSHRWHCSLQISLEGCDSNCLHLVAVFLFNYQLQKWVGPLTLHLDPAGVSAISTRGNTAAPMGAQGQLGGRGSVSSPTLTPPYRVTPRDTVLEGHRAPSQLCWVQVNQEIVSVHPGCPVSHSPFSPGYGIQGQFKTSVKQVLFWVNLSLRSLKHNGAAKQLFFPSNANLP